MKLKLLIVLLIVLISPAKATLIENVRCTSYASQEGDGKYGCKGDLLKEGYCAADPRYYPYNSQLLINGRKYIVKDIGSAVKGRKHIDLFCNSLKKMHQQGTLYAKVEILTPDNLRLTTKSPAKSILLVKKDPSSRATDKLVKDFSCYNKKNIVYSSKHWNLMFNRLEKIKTEILLCDNE